MADDEPEKSSTSTLDTVTNTAQDESEQSQLQY